MEVAPPLFPAPDGYHWELQLGVEVFAGPSGASALNLPPSWNADGTLYISNFEGRTTYTFGANYGLAGAVTYELGRSIYAQFQTYIDGSADELVAVSWDEAGVSEAAGSRCINVNTGAAFRYDSAPPAVWPQTLQVTYQTHSHDAVAGSLAADMLKWVGDVWAAVPTTNAPVPPPNNDCPPPCSPLTGGATTAGGQEAQDASAEITWPRTNRRVDVAHLNPGRIAHLTYGDEWDDALAFVLDSYTLDLAALENGGFTQRCAYTFLKMPLTDPLGEPLFFTVNVHLTNDAAHLVQR